MPVTPDPNAVVVALLQDANTKLDRLIKLWEEAPAPSQPPANENAEFLEKWKVLPWTEFAQRYPEAAVQGAVPGVKIPAMVGPDVAEAIFRARAGYNVQGTLGQRNLDGAAAAVAVIASATQENATDAAHGYETGDGLAYPDMAAYGFLTGLFALRADYAASLGARRKPRDFAGVTLEAFIASQFGGGSPGIG